jgi:hypothetical protein
MTRTSPKLTVFPTRARFTVPMEDALRISKDPPSCIESNGHSYVEDKTGLREDVAPSFVMGRAQVCFN